MNENLPPWTARNSPLPGVKVLLIGDSGTGKTFCLQTLIDAGVTPLCLFTENSFDVVGATDPRKFHWMYVPPVIGTFAALKEMSQRIGTMQYEQITKTHDNTRFTNSPWMRMLAGLMDFKCERTGESFGNAGDWGTDKCLVLDSMSGMIKMSRQNAVGNRPALSPPDYNLIQIQIENLVNQLTLVFRCHVVITAHAEREIDPVMGGQKIMASTIGKALSPVLPRYFTDCILTKRTGIKFEWDTLDSQAVLKARNVPIAGNLPPSFVPLIAEWKKRGGLIETPSASLGKPTFEEITK